MKQNQIFLIVGVVAIVLLILNWNKVFAKRVLTATNSGTNSEGETPSGEDSTTVVVDTDRMSVSRQPIVRPQAPNGQRAKSGNCGNSCTTSDGKPGRIICVGDEETCLEMPDAF